MSKVNVLLLLALVMVALYVVQTRYESRRLFVELERLRHQSTQLDTERDRLEVQMRAQATPARIESLARTQLQMRPASPAVTLYVKDSGAEVKTMQGGQP